jgi:ubiquinone/menaquinone biosynthesis C-methylase UbiE
MEELHSAAYFGPFRDFWWNPDQLALFAVRAGFDRARSVLDVGAGVGHWGRLLSHVLPAEASFVGIDSEPRWVEEATARAAEAGLADRFSYREGPAEALPFEDGSFDLVTCQTLLMHVPDATAVVNEMVRVTKPGGLVAAAEPNNRALILLDTSETADWSVDQRLDAVRFVLLCEAGKLALGEGNNSIGDLVPGLFADAGLEELQACQSDKVGLMVAPYEGEQQQALKESYMEDARSEMWGWPRDDARRYYVAGGGTEDEFDAAWDRRIAENRRLAAALEAGTFHCAGGGPLYLVAGRKPR